MDLKNPTNTEKFLEALIKFDKWREEGKPQSGASATPDRVRNRTSAAYSYHSNQKQDRRYNPQQDNRYNQQQYSMPSHNQHVINPLDHSQPQNVSSKQDYHGCWTCGATDHYRHECTKNY